MGRCLLSVSTSANCWPFPRFQTRRLPASPAAAAGQGTILLADDVPAVLAVARPALVSQGYHVVTAADGQEAVEKFCEAPASFAAVVLDFTMPRLDGRATIVELKRIAPRLPVVLTTGLASDLLSSEVVSLAEGVLSKPFTLASLHRGMRRALANSAADGTTN